MDRTKEVVTVVDRTEEQVMWWRRFYDSWGQEEVGYDGFPQVQGWQGTCALQRQEGLKCGWHVKAFGSFYSN